jgi:hypothetical protein
MKIFWSWQSDTPGKTGRHFIRQALLDAITELKEVEDIEEPNERANKDALHLDHDRQGVAGSPDLVRTIFQKIEASVVFVADITAVSVIPSRKVGDEEVKEKRNMNPNVAIELGYALSGLGDNFLMVMNTHYGGREFVPFDLAARGGPIMFCLPPDADGQKIKAESASLKGKLITALRPFIKSQEATTPTSSFVETPSTASAATYFTPGEPLAGFGDDDDRVEYVCSDSNGFYLRVMPFTPLSEPFYSSTLAGELSRSKLCPLWNQQGLVAANRFGAITIEPKSNNGGEIKASTQVFVNGEIWGFAPRLLCSDQNGNYVPGKLFESIYYNALHSYVRFMVDNLGITPPYTIEAGAVGIQQFQIIVGPTIDDRRGPFYQNEMKLRVVLNNNTDESIDAVLLLVFEELFRISGYPRPQGLYGFPSLAP